MLYLNKNGDMFGDPIKPGQFPDKTQIVKLDNTFLYQQDLYKHEWPLAITWIYENDAEMATLMYVVRHLQNELGSLSHIILYLPYIPNARMDRTKERYEVFTLKYFCEFINSLNFDRVIVFDPHSDVSVCMLDRVFVDKQRLNDIIRDMAKKAQCVFFPDAGAKKRYAGCLPSDKPVYYGEKVREWSTGKILGLDVKSEGYDVADLKGKSVVLIDDIIAYGGTMYYSVKKLKELGVGSVIIYCSHLENSVLDEEKSTLLPMLNDGTVEALWTTDSLFRGDHKRILQTSVEPCTYEPYSF